MWRRFGLIRQIKLNLLKFIRLRGTPDEIAKGMALGIFIGMSPTFGFQMAIAVFFAFLLKENKLAAVLGVWITNPVTAPFIYALEYESGRLLLGMSRVSLPAELTFDSLKVMGWEVMAPLGLGSLIYGLACAALAFALTLRAVPLVKAWNVPRWPRPRKKN
ncbi:DUF2062 domain-containing protein [Trichloromonas sp.]|uniref:DUF2062 domain-containing protein n=1 Tax=Trichloromonas sp. TaxID=3069249 RepID=UPI003D819A6E